MTARDKGHIEEITLALKKLSKDYNINFDVEINWLKDLENRLN